MTVLRFSGGETLRVALSIEEVQKLLQQALAKQTLLELKAPDGRVLVINPSQVQYLQKDVYRTEPDNTIGPLIRTYHGPLARLRSWWHTRTPHIID